MVPNESRMIKQWFASFPMSADNCLKQEITLDADKTVHHKSTLYILKSSYSWPLASSLRGLSVESNQFRLDLGHRNKDSFSPPPLRPRPRHTKQRARSITLPTHPPQILQVHCLVSPIHRSTSCWSDTLKPLELFTIVPIGLWCSLS